MSDFQEGYYIVENDRNQYAAETDPMVIGGPYGSELEADLECPEDFEGIEYGVHHIRTGDKHLYRGI